MGALKQGRNGDGRTGDRRNQNYSAVPEDTLKEEEGGTGETRTILLCQKIP